MPKSNDNGVKEYNNEISFAEDAKGFEDDGMEFDFSDFESRPPPANTREAVVRSVTDFGSGFKNDLLDNKLSHISNAAQAAIPSKLQKDFYDIKDVVTDNVNYLKDEVTNIRKGLAGAVEGFNRLMPKDSGVNKKLNDLVKKLRGETSFSSSDTKSKEQMNQDEANAGILEALGALQDKQHTDTALANAIATQQHADNLSVLKSIYAETKLQRDFHYEITNKYYRKNLEMQYKHFFVLRELTEVTKSAFDGFKNQFESIVKNTALPDIVKTYNSELIKSSMGNKLRSEMSEVLFNSIAPMDAFKKKANQTIKNAVAFGKEKIQGWIDTSDQLYMIKEMFDDASEYGMTPAQLIGGMVPSMMINKLGNMVGDRIEDKEWVKKVEYQLKRFTSDPRYAMRELNRKTQNKFSEKEGYTEYDFLDDDDPKKRTWLQKLLAKGIRHSTSFLSGATTFSNEQNDIELGRVELDKVHTFDGRAHTAIVKIIPGLLSKILAEVKTARVGGDVKDNEVFWDSRYETFKDRKEISKDFHGIYEKGVKRAKNDVERITDILKRIGVTIPKNLLRDFENAVFTYCQSGSTSTHIESIFTSEFLRYIHSRKLRKILESSKAKIRAATKDNPDLLNEFSLVMNNIKTSLPRYDARLKELYDSGHTDLVKSMGVTREDDYGNLRIDNDLRSKLYHKHFHKMYKNNKNTPGDDTPGGVSSSGMPSNDIPPTDGSSGGSTTTPPGVNVPPNPNNPSGGEPGPTTTNTGNTGPNGTDGNAGTTGDQKTTKGPDTDKLKDTIINNAKKVKDKAKEAFEKSGIKETKVYQDLEKHSMVQKLMAMDVKKDIRDEAVKKFDEALKDLRGLDAEEAKAKMSQMANNITAKTAKLSEDIKTLKNNKRVKDFLENENVKKVLGNLDDVKTKASDAFRVIKENEHVTKVTQEVKDLKNKTTKKVEEQKEKLDKKVDELLQTEYAKKLGLDKVSKEKIKEEASKLKDKGVNKLKDIGDKGLNIGITVKDDLFNFSDEVKAKGAKEAFLNTKAATKSREMADETVKMMNKLREDVKEKGFTETSKGIKDSIVNKISSLDVKERIKQSKLINKIKSSTIVNKLDKEISDLKDKPKEELFTLVKEKPKGWFEALSKTKLVESVTKRIKKDTNNDLPEQEIQQAATEIVENRVTFTQKLQNIAGDKYLGDKIRNKLDGYKTGMFGFLGGHKDKIAKAYAEAGGLRGLTLMASSKATEKIRARTDDEVVERFNKQQEQVNNVESSEMKKEEQEAQVYIEKNMDQLKMAFINSDEYRSGLINSFYDWLKFMGFPIRAIWTIAKPLYKVGMAILKGIWKVDRFVAKFTGWMRPDKLFKIGKTVLKYPIKAIGFPFKMLGKGIGAAAGAIGRFITGRKKQEVEMRESDNVLKSVAISPLTVLGKTLDVFSSVVGKMGNPGGDPTYRKNSWQERLTKWTKKEPHPEERGKSLWQRIKDNKGKLAIMTAIGGIWAVVQTMGINITDLLTKAKDIAVGVWDVVKGIGKVGSTIGEYFGKFANFLGFNSNETMTAALGGLAAVAGAGFLAKKGIGLLPKLAISVGLLAAKGLFKGFKSLAGSLIESGVEWNRNRKAKKGKKGKIPKGGKTPDAKPKTPEKPKDTPKTDKKADTKPKEQPKPKEPPKTDTKASKNDIKPNTNTTKTPTTPSKPSVPTGPTQKWGYWKALGSPIEFIKDVIVRPIKRWLDKGNRVIRLLKIITIKAVSRKAAFKILGYITAKVTAWLAAAGTGLGALATMASMTADAIGIAKSMFWNGYTMLEAFVYEYTGIVKEKLRNAIGTTVELFFSKNLDAPEEEIDKLEDPEEYARKQQLKELNAKKEQDMIDEETRKEEMLKRANELRQKEWDENQRKLAKEKEAAVSPKPSTPPKINNDATGVGTTVEPNKKNIVDGDAKKTNFETSKDIKSKDNKPKDILDKSSDQDDDYFEYVYDIKKLRTLFSGDVYLKKFTALHPEFQRRLINLAKDNKALGRKPLQLNDAKRTFAEQDVLYQKWKKYKEYLKQLDLFKQGKISKKPAEVTKANKAAEPSRLASHIAGFAVDIQSKDVNELDKLGLLEKHNVWAPLSEKNYKMRGRKNAKNYVNGVEDWHVEMPEFRGYDYNKIKQQRPDSKGGESWLSRPSDKYLNSIVKQYGPGYDVNVNYVDKGKARRIMTPVKPESDEPMTQEEIMLVDNNVKPNDTSKKEAQMKQAIQNNINSMVQLSSYSPTSNTNNNTGSGGSSEPTGPVAYNMMGMPMQMSSTSDVNVSNAITGSTGSIETILKASHEVHVNSMNYLKKMVEMMEANMQPKDSKPNEPMKTIFPESVVVLKREEEFAI